MHRFARVVLALCAILLAAVVGAALAFVGGILVAVVVAAVQGESTSYEGPLVVGMFSAPIGAVLGMLLMGAFIDWRRRRRPG